MHELGITKFFNENFAGLANAVLTAAGIPAADPHKPWTNYMAMEILVVLLLLALPWLVRAGFSVAKPGKLAQTFELLYEGIDGMAHEIIGHDSKRYVGYFLTVFVFILVCNLIGIIPAFESPTMYPAVPLGCALATFLFYNFHGFRVQGVVGYLKHFAGPIIFLAWFMFPLEILSHLVRPVSLTIRLFANMLAGEQVTMGFLGLAPWVIPVLFMALHVFVSFLQAFIFTVLSMLYVGGAVEHAEDHH